MRKVKSKFWLWGIVLAAFVGAGVFGYVTRAYGPLVWSYDRAVARETGELNALKDAKVLAANVIVPCADILEDDQQCQTLFETLKSSYLLKAIEPVPQDSPRVLYERALDKVTANADRIASVREALQTQSETVNAAEEARVEELDSDARGALNDAVEELQTAVDELQFLLDEETIADAENLIGEGQDALESEPEGVLVRDRFAHVQQLQAVTARLQERIEALTGDGETPEDQQVETPTPQDAQPAAPVVPQTQPTTPQVIPDTGGEQPAPDTQQTEPAQPAPEEPAPVEPAPAPNNDQPADQPAEPAPAPDVAQ